jgi:alpha-1,3-glucosyltransferase
VVKMKQLFSNETLALMSAFSTFMSVIPSGLHLLKNPTFYHFKCSLVISSLGFFLFSYQVHEKSILLAALPVCLFLNEELLTCLWFFVVSTFSLQPLLVKDGLFIPYMALTTLLLVTYFNVYGDLGLSQNTTFKNKAKNLLFMGSMMGCLFLGLSSLIISPPSRYPDIHPVLNSVFSCLHFMAFLAHFYRLQFSQTSVPYQSISSKKSS